MVQPDGRAQPIADTAHEQSSNRACVGVLVLIAGRGKRASTATRSRGRSAAIFGPRHLFSWITLLVPLDLLGHCLKQVDVDNGREAAS
jgi:hypothetical protein